MNLLIVVYPTVSSGPLLDLGNKSSSCEGIGSIPVHLAAVSWGHGPLTWSLC